MGEVFRAYDLRLGQTVALKFLPPELAKDAKRLEYFHNEVRLARQISHPNVCRVYDIGEVDGMLGERSRAAIKLQQEQLGHVVNGRGGQEVLNALSGG